MGLPSSATQVRSTESERFAVASVELLERAPFAVIRHDAELVVTGWNEGAARCFGFSEEEALGRSVAELLFSGDQAEAWRRALAEGEPRVFDCVKKGGGSLACEWRNQSVAVVAGEGDRSMSWICMGLPVPGQSPRGPTVEERVLSVVLNSLPIAIWAVDKEGTYIFHDGMGVDLAGAQRRSWVGQSLWQLWGDHEGARDMLHQVKEALHEKRSTRAVASAMDRCWESWYVPDLDERGEVQGVITVTLDVTESKRAEGELRTKLELIQRQQRLIQQLSTPIIRVWDGVLTAPLVGVVDSARASELMDNLLGEVSRSGSQYAIIDLTGVDIVDTQTAAYLIDLVRAIRLLGAEAVITGIRATVAQTIISLGVDLSGIPVHTNLRSGLQHCIQQMAREGRPARERAALGPRHSGQ
ncbi:PAS domain-containing protein [Sorangium sp. So ce388]|uniref:PAS domain-containing protein n=1 Tax=Sorangium sp. So ce388 TaxID=3133309 RepID=UPI003F5BD688